MYEIGANEEEQKIQRELDRINRMTAIERKIASLKREGLLDKKTEAELRAELESEQKMQKELDRINRMSPIELKREYLRKEGLLDAEAEAELESELESERQSKLSEEEIEKEFNEREAQEDEDLSRGRVRKESNRIPWFS